MISEAVRKEVMERDHGECQFMHRQPVEATEISHFDHQGIGGLPPDHLKNQADNLAASCGECHRKFSGPGPVHIWEEFMPGALMVICDPKGKVVSGDDLWFYVRCKVDHLQQTEARIQGLAMIEGDVARDLYELSKGYKLLEPDAVSFAQYIAGRNVSATKATQAARAYGWMEERGLEWPVGLTSEKADIIRRAIEDDGYADAQLTLLAAVDQSVSDLKQELIDAGLMKASVRWYVTTSTWHCDYPARFIRVRKVEEALKVVDPSKGDVLVRADKFVAGLNWDRASKVLSDRDGNEIPYKDLA